MNQLLQRRSTKELEAQELEDFTPLILFRCIDFQDSYLYSYKELKFYIFTMFKNLNSSATAGTLRIAQYFIT